ncbi:hypothetical protein ANO11243_055810 [Dothideomycetidae sp. 11243]|nr:hypothetical protein ANO11243_055810 [fungal sp. No.11243]
MITSVPTSTPITTPTPTISPMPYIPENATVGVYNQYDLQWIVDTYTLTYTKYHSTFYPRDMAQVAETTTYAAASAASAVATACMEFTSGTDTNSKDNVCAQFWFDTGLDAWECQTYDCSSTGDPLVASYSETAEWVFGYWMFNED